MKKSLLIITLFLQFLAFGAYAQQIIKGKVVDSLTNETLPGASVGFKGTKNFVSTALDGSFVLKNQQGANVLVVSFIGYLPKEITLQSGQTDLGNIQILPNSNLMSEVTIIGSNIAIDRKTPVAVSTVSAAQIEEKGGSQEFPELLKATPGVQATKQGGGFGDSRVSIRGFNAANVAVLVNGVPVNDMENGSIYWSNWASLRDVTSSMQVQRGLGATKLIVPSLGGTINIITKSTDAVQGGSVAYTTGNDGYNKIAVSLSTGLNDKGWAFSAQGSKTEGRGYADGLDFKAYNYFFNVSKQFNENHILSLTGMGAPQWHGQRSTKQTIATFENAPQGIKFNGDWGVKDGKFTSVKYNYYNKPVVSLNDYWTINSTSSLSSVLYASTGSGGGSGNLGTALTRTGDKYSPYDLDAAVNANVATVDGSAASYLYSNTNDHHWFGALSTYNKKLTDNLNLTGGVDLRYYKGYHTEFVTDLLGADYATYPYTGSGNFAGNINDQSPILRTGDKFAYNYNSDVFWEGLNVQAEYTKDALSAFVTLAGSNTSYRRTDFFNYLDGDPAQKSKYINFLGYQAKGGANYNINQNHNVFANVGYLTKAPIFSSTSTGGAFLNGRNDVNADAKNEKLFSYELGYGYRSAKLTANLNLYRSTYKDRLLSRSLDIDGTGELTYFNVTGVSELHQGVELDLKYRPLKIVTLSAMISVGDWKYINDVGPLTVTAQNSIVKTVYGQLYLKDQKVGNQAQTTAALGLDVDVLPEVKIGADYNYYGNYKSDFNFYSLTTAASQPWKIPNYHLLDLNGSFRFKIANLNSSVYVNVNNIFDTKYVSDAYDASGAGTAAGSTVFYGFGRTWTTGLKINF